MKAIILVLDGFGVGEMDDAVKFGDIGSNTYKNLRKQIDFELPNLRLLGLDNIDGIELNKCDEVLGSYGRLRERSVNKDTLTGHWEMMGIETHHQFQAFPNTIDSEVVRAVQEEIGETLCNRSASGTQIIYELGAEHLRTGLPILYSSADSVLQIATHKGVFSIQQLYELCERVRKRMTRDFDIQRIIARPFDTDQNGEFYRTKERKDFAIDPPIESTLDRIVKKGFRTIGIGKIAEIFNYKGIQESYKTTCNAESLKKTLEVMDEKFDGLIFVNLIDTDMLYGHRNDAVGYAGALQDFDAFLPKIFRKMTSEDMLIITGDHGNDPTTPSTNHSREYTPILMYGNGVEKNKNLGTVDGFRLVGDSVYEMLTKTCKGGV